MVPAHLRHRAAGPELGSPGGARGLPRDPALLGRPRRGRVPRGRRPFAGQGPVRAAAERRRAGCDAAGRHPPAVGPRRGARGLRRLALRVRGVHAAAHRGRRGLGDLPGAARPLREPRGPRPGVQLRPAGGGLRRRRLPPHHHRQPGAVGPHRLLQHLGALQPRRGPPRHPLRPAAAGRPPGEAGCELARGGRPRGGHRPGAGPAPRPRGESAGAGPARQRLPLPGRGAGAAGGGRDPRRRAAGPGVLAHHPRGPRLRRAGTGRHPGAAALDAGGLLLRLRRGPGAPAAAGVVRRRLRRGAGGGPLLDAVDVPPGAAAAPRAGGTGGADLERGAQRRRRADLRAPRRLAVRDQLRRAAGGDARRGGAAGEHPGPGPGRAGHRAAGILHGLAAALRRAAGRR